MSENKGGVHVRRRSGLPILALGVVLLVISAVGVCIMAFQGRH